MYKAEKVAQMAAFFLAKRGGTMAHVKLMKLLYIADRKSIEEYEYPISYDSMASMEFGPVLSSAIDLANGSIADEAWSSWVSPIENNEVSLQREDMAESDLGMLSRADLGILDQVFDEFGNVGRWDVVRMAHEFPEYTDPGKSSFPIHYREIFEALDYSAVDARAIESEIIHQKDLHRANAR